MEFSTRKYFSQVELIISLACFEDLGAALFIDAAADQMKKESGRSVQEYYFTYKPGDLDKNMITLVTLSEIVADRLLVNARQSELMKAIQSVKGFNPHLKFAETYTFGWMNDDFQRLCKTAVLNFKLCQSDTTL